MKYIATVLLLLCTIGPAAAQDHVKAEHTTIGGTLRFLGPGGYSDDGRIWHCSPQDGPDVWRLYRGRIGVYLGDLPLVEEGSCEGVQSEWHLYGFYRNLHKEDVVVIMQLGASGVEYRIVEIFEDDEPVVSESFALLGDPHPVSFGYARSPSGEYENIVRLGGDRGATYRLKR